MIINQNDLAQIQQWCTDESGFQKTLSFLSQKTKGHGLLFLHIDDDNLYLEALGRYLATSGYRVFSLSDCQLALKVLAAVSPSVIILDFYMPELDGGELYKLIRRTEAGTRIPIIFLTSGADEQIKQCQEETGELFLSKNLPPDVLVSKLSEVIFPS